MVAPPGSVGPVAPPETATSRLHLRQLAIGYVRPLLSGIDLAFSAGQRVVLLGPNGGGKSTLLRTLCGMLPPLAGAVEWQGGRPRFGYMPQRDRFDPAVPLSAADLCLQGLLGDLRWQRIPGVRERTLVDAALAQVGAADLAARAYRTLSGGQQQRVLLARALVRTPDVLLVDEPLAALDRDGAHAMIDLLARFGDTAGRLTFVVTHSLELARRIATLVIGVDHTRNFFALRDAEALNDRNWLMALLGGEQQDPPGGAPS